MRSASSSTNCLYRVQAQLAGGQQVAHPPRRADHDIGAAPHLLHLPEPADAAQDGDAAQPQVDGEPAQAVVDLQRQFAGGGQDQRPRGEGRRPDAIGGQVLQQRQAEGGGLAAAGLGDAQQVAASEQGGDGVRLDRCRCIELLRRQGAQQRLGQAEDSKGRKGHVIEEAPAPLGPEIIRAAQTGA